MFPWLQNMIGIRITRIKCPALLAGNHVITAHHAARHVSTDVIRHAASNHHRGASQRRGWKSTHSLDLPQRPSPSCRFTLPFVPKSGQNWPLSRALRRSICHQSYSSGCDAGMLHLARPVPAEPVWSLPQWAASVASSHQNTPGLGSASRWRISH